jgi:hypothetical protein
MIQLASSLRQAETAMFLAENDGGHSLGGLMACVWVCLRPSLTLCGCAYPLALWTHEVVPIMATYLA